MHKCCLPSGVPIESPSAYEKSLVHKIFGGCLRSQVKCMQCSFCSNNYDPFLNLSLEILKADSLEMALCHFIAKEQLDGGAKQYQCQQCKQKARPLKQHTIYKAPLVLTVHLKRFGYIHGQKIDNKIAFGSTLDLKPFVSVTHVGDLNYTLYGSCACWLEHTLWPLLLLCANIKWNVVVQVNERKVLEQKAYMLFYAQGRKRFCRKKPIDILQKGNKIMNAYGKSYAKFSQDSNDKVHNYSTEKNIDAPISTASSVSTSSMRVGDVATAPMEKIVDMKQRGQNPSVVGGSPYCSKPKDCHYEGDTVDFVAMPSLPSEDKTKESPSKPADQLLKSEAVCALSGDMLEMDDTNYGMCDGGVMSAGTSKEALNQVNGVGSSIQNSAGEYLVGVGEKSDDAAMEEILESKEVKCRSGDKDLEICRKSPGFNEIISNDAINSDLERSGFHGMTLSIDNQQGAGASRELVMESRLKNMMTMLNQGLEETTVARWIPLMLLCLRKLKLKQPCMTTQIGYIGDEWREEYDEGQRKKLRKCMTTFGEPNSGKKLK